MLEFVAVVVGVVLGVAGTLVALRLLGGAGLESARRTRALLL